MTDAIQKKYDDARKLSQNPVEAALAAIHTSEDEGDAINERLINAADEIAEIFNFHTDKIRPFEAAKLVPLFVEAVNYLTDLDPDRLAEELVELRSLSGDALGQLIRGFPITGPMADEIDQHLAVDVARVIGPDHAQNWYRFAVLVTKLA